MQIETRRKDLMSDVVPGGEGNKKPVPVGIPEKLLLRLDACARATGNSRTDVILKLLRRGLADFEAEQASHRPKKSA